MAWVAVGMRLEREGGTDSLRSTCIAPESARMGEGVIEHNRGGLEESSSSDSSVRFQSSEGVEVGKL
jgi:hypothetical protein